MPVASTSFLPEALISLVLSPDHSEDVPSHHHLASDSDSEVYCDSMDQFGLEEVGRAQQGGDYE